MRYAGRSQERGQHTGLHAVGLLRRELVHNRTHALAMQVNLRVTPESSGSRTFGTVGTADTVLVLFGVAEGGLFEKVDADDNSGEARNALFSAALDGGAEYVLRTRLCYKEDAAKVGVYFA